MPSFVVFVLLAFSTGVALAVQTGVNTQLRSFLGSPLQAVFVSFSLGTLLLMLTLGVRREPPPFARWLSMPWWMWLGGLFGLFIVSTNILVAPRIGSALLVSLAVAGQLCTAVILDHYGAFGFPVHHISPGRIAGAALLVGGVVLIRYS
jgi:transporter family-2 protein